MERPDFKSGRGRKPVLGGFDPHSLPPAETSSNVDVVPKGRDEGGRSQYWVRRRDEYPVAVATKRGGAKKKRKAKR